MEKPKLFFIQACRGDKLQKHITVDGESLPNTSDFFFSFVVPRLPGFSTYGERLLVCHRALSGNQ